MVSYSDNHNLSWRHNSVGYLPSNLEALNSNPNIAKKKKNLQQGFLWIHLKIKLLNFSVRALTLLEVVDLLLFCIFLVNIH
jgi:hypothetical protein